MHHVVEAVYENGVFRPLKKLKLSEGQEFQLTIRSKTEISPDEMLKLAAEIYEDLSEEEVRDIEEIARDRSRFFEEETSS